MGYSVQYEGIAPSSNRQNGPTRFASGEELICDVAATAPKTVRFETTLSAFGNNTGIVVPPELISELGAGKRPQVSVDLNGHVFLTTVGVMSGQHLVSVSAALRAATGLTGGDPIRVTLTLEAAPRSVNVPDDFAAALSAAPGARAFFDALSNSLQRFHIDTVSSAKTDETRVRRIDKAVALFLAGKSR